MLKISRLLLLAVAFTGTAYGALTDRGNGKRAKNKVVANISIPTTLRNSISFNLRYGLKYTGSLIANHMSVNNTLSGTSLITYQKGNVTYIIPYKQRLIIPEVKQGYTGMKLIIKKNK